jgi:hypothetical protein
MELTKILSSGIDANSVTPAILTKIQSSFDANSSTLTVPNFSVTTVTAGNVKTNNLLYANGSAYVFSGSNAAGSNTQIQFNNANSFAASVNLTFDSTTNTLATTNLNVTGNVALTGANVSLGEVGNIKITGGAGGHVLQTDGFGTLSWVSPTGSGSVFSISKGTSNVNVPIENGNITIGIGGVSNVVVVTTTGIVVKGNVDAGANYVIGNGYYLTDIDAGTANIANSIILGNTSIKAIQNGNVFIDVAGTTNTVVFTSTGANIAGYANITGNVNAPYFIGNGAFLTGVDTSPANISNGNSNVQVTSSGGNVTTSIGGTANVLVVSSTNVDVTGNITASSNVTAKNELIVGNAATASDNWGRIRLVSSSNTYGYTVGSPALVISHEEDGTNQAIVLGDASALSSDTLFGISVLSGGNTSPTIGNEVGWTSRLNLAGNGNLVIAGKLTSVDADLGNAVSANYFIGNVANITGNVTAGNISTSGSGGNITGANVVSANTFIGSGNNLSNIQGANVTGAVSSATTAGTVTTAAQPNITTVGTLTGFTSNGVVNFTNASNVTLGAVGNVRVTGGSTGQYLQTDGSGTLTWATINTGTPTTIANGNSNVNIPSANGNVNISAVGNANVVVVTGTGANINGYANISGTVTAGNISTSGTGGNITGANVVSANTFTASGNITATNANLGNATTANYFIGNLYGTANLATHATTANSVAGANVSGQVSNALISGTVYTNAQPNITSIGTLTDLSVSNSATIGSASGSISVTNTTGFYTTWSTAQQAAAWTVSFWVYIPTQSINYPRSLFYNGDDGGAQAVRVYLSWNGASLYTLQLENRIGGTGSNFTKTLSGAVSQDVWHFVTVSYNGTNTVYLGLDGDVSSISGTAISSGYAGLAFGRGTVGTGFVNTYGPQTYTDVELTLGTASYTSNFTPPTTHPTSSGKTLLLLAKSSATYITNEVTGTNVSINGSPTFDSSNPIAPTGSLTVALSANLGNAVTANYFVGNGSLLTGVTVNSIAGANVSGQVGNALIASTVYTNAQPNITSVGTLTGITSTGTANFTGASNVALGPVANVHITGGSTGQYLQTDGSGVLNWASISTSSTLANVNSSVNIPTANGNVNITSAGNTSLVVTDTGANIAGTLNVTGNATVSNITGANVVSANTFTASANITASNANLGNAVTANYFVGNLYGTANLATYATTANAVEGANVSGQVGNSLIAGTVYTAAQPNITSVGTLTDLSVSGNAVVTGNLVVNGALEYTNVNNLYIKDPIIELGGGVNVAPLTSNDGKDRGTLLHYHTSAPVDAFMGWDNSNAEFAFGSNVSVASEVVTFNSLGNVRASYFIGNGSQLTGITATSGNANYANYAGNAFSVTGSNVSGQVGNALVAGTVYTNAQPNITSLGTLTSLNVSSTVTAVAFTANTGVFTGNGNGLSSIVGANVTGQVSFAATANAVAGANVSGQVGNALIAGTVYTNAQPNITSVGTLSNVSVSGNVNASIIVNGGTGVYMSAGPAGYINFFTTDGDKATITDTGNIAASNLIANSTIFATTANISGNVTAGNANLGNAAVASFFVGSGAFLTSVTAITAGTVTTNAQPNITSVGLLTSLVVGNATANSTFGNGNITASGNISFTGANVSLGDASNLKITGGSSGYFLTTDGAGNLSWGAASGGGGVSATGSNTQLQFNDGGALGASANLTFDKATNTFATARITASNGANLGSNVANVYIGGGSNNQILKTDGSGNLSWIAQPATTITVDNFTGDGTTVAYTLTASPTSINQTAVNYNGTLQLRAAYTVSGSTLTFSEAPVNGSLIEVTTTLGVMSGAGAFVTRSYTGNGVQSTFAVTSGCTVSSVIVTENGLVQVPTTDYTISGSTLTFNGAPANGIIINIRELAIATATSSPGITWNIASSNATMVAGNGYFIDTSGGAKTMTLPSSAILGDTIRINDLAGSFATNNLTVARNGHKIQGIADDLLIDTDQSSFGLVYSNSTYGWKVLEL